jgi:hypothetical protein
VFLILSKIAVSLICNLMIKTGKTLHLSFNLKSGVIEIEKQPSASVNPVINQGLSLGL